MITLWILMAFACGFLSKQIGLPPLVGYLLAGFGLHAYGFEPHPALEVLSELGVTLLLFTIGLKLNVESLFKKEIWASAGTHMGLITGLTIINSAFLAGLGMTYFVNLDWQAASLIGFSVSFSSTVCAVKFLEARGEMRARHGQVAIGILVIQDIAAVLFVTIASGKAPSPWALLLLLLPMIRPLLGLLLQRSGHGELLPLAGFFLALSAGELFEWVGLKAHLGALIVAVLLSGHTKAAELSKSLMDFKDLFLIGFFLSIGFTALPTMDMLGVALIMAVALPFKAFFFFLLLVGFRLRSRTAFLSALSLSNYSEFGLIVCAMMVPLGLLPKEWLVIMALAVSFSFAFSGILNARAHRYYSQWGHILKRFERKIGLPEDQFSPPPDATVLVMGMGRVGTGAYDVFEKELNVPVGGVDVDRALVLKQKQAGRCVVKGDVEDPEFWSHVDFDTVQLVMFAVPNYLDMLEAIKQLKRAGYRGKTAGVVAYDDEKQELLDAGIDEVFNFYDNAGAGFAEHSAHLLGLPGGRDASEGHA